MQGERPRSVLLYPGAGNDAYPLTIAAVRASHTHVIFFDQQPSRSAGGSGGDEAVRVLGKRAREHEKDDSDEQRFVLLKLQAQAGDALVGPPVRVGDHWRAELRGGSATFLYFFNVRYQELESHPTLAVWLPAVHTLLCRAFPFPKRLVRLPNLRCVCASVLCEAETVSAKCDNATSRGTMCLFE